GTPEDIVAAPADDYVASFTQDVDRGRVISAGRVMRPAHAVDARAPDVAQRVRAAADALFVTDPEGRPVGLAVAGAVRRDFARTTPSAKLAELFEACARDLPVAVVDESGRLLGAVHPADVFLELSRGGEAGAGAPAPLAGAAAARPAGVEAAHG